MKISSETIFRFLEKAIKWIALFPLCLLFIFSILYRNSVSFDIAEVSIISKNNFTFFLVVVLCIPFFYGACKLLKYIPEKILFLSFTIIYLLAGIFVLTNIEMVPRYDSGSCYFGAAKFLDGVYDDMQLGEYFYIYPHQMGLVTYNCLLISISDNPVLFYALNLLWIILTNMALWKCSCLLFEEKPFLRKLIIILSFCFLPQFFYLFFAYGQVPGLMCLSWALYFGCRFLKNKGNLNLIPLFIFTALSCLLRENYLIGGIALIIIFLLKVFQDKKWTHLLVVIGLICCLLVPAKLVNSYYEKATDSDLNNGIPSLLFVAMGLQENIDTWRAKGWFNAFTTDTFASCNYDAEAASAIALDSIKDRLSYFVENPGYAGSFFQEKIVTTWCEPTFQSIWSGPLIYFGCETDSKVLADLYSAGKSFELLSFMMNIFLILLFGFSLWNVISKTFVKKEAFSSFELFSILFFLGGFLFHLIWETKSQYVYPYIVMLIPFACQGICEFFTLIDSAIAKRKNK